VHGEYLAEAFFVKYPDWQAGKRLGSGACGVVYAAEHPVTKEILFAIKKSSMSIDQSRVCASSPNSLDRSNITP
jgi:hypothetical protein